MLARLLCFFVVITSMLFAGSARSNDDELTGWEKAYAITGSGSLVTLEVSPTR
ncbi:hypothetical protein SAMN02799615_03733 [Dyella marensis]|uniref:Uncharacterized protein n=1 Tax=Dyella marensis TaxID=500610 RepID=A0A1I2J467_9GAMM|nr:hypothetical protein SAMN02799615_03733 [Dyella marensis]